jgi:hypothetical protein
MHRLVHISVVLFTDKSGSYVSYPSRTQDLLLLKKNHVIFQANNIFFLRFGIINFVFLIKIIFFCPSIKLFGPNMASQNLKTHLKSIEFLHVIFLA